MFNPNQTGGGGQMAPPVGKSRFLHNRTSVSPLWSSRKKPRVLYPSRFNRGGPTKFENTFFQIAKFRFSTIFEISQGASFKDLLDSSPLYWGRGWGVVWFQNSSLDNRKRLYAKTVLVYHLYIFDNLSFIKIMKKLQDIRQSQKNKFLARFCKS